MFGVKMTVKLEDINVEHIHNVRLFTESCELENKFKVNQEFCY